MIASSNRAPIPKSVFIWLAALCAIGFLMGIGVSRLLPGALPSVYRAMKTAKVSIITEPGDVAEIIPVKVARTEAELTAGFMNVPAGEIRLSGIFFVLPCAGDPVTFHMKQVRAPLDVAFIDRNGVVLATDLMTPGTTGRVWEAPVGTCAAIELPAGRLEKLGVKSGTSHIQLLEGSLSKD